MTQPAQRSGATMVRYEPLTEFNRLTRQLAKLFDDPWPNVPSVLGRKG